MMVSWIPGRWTLTDDLPPVAQGGPMDLAERGGRDRLLLEGRKGLGDLDPELRGDDGMRLFIGEGLDLVLEPREGLQERGRQQVGPRGEELAQLHVRGAELLQIGGQLLGRLGWRGLARSGRFARVRDEVRPSIFDEEGGQVLVTFEMLGT
jgi:hypothetical protein